MAMEDRGTAELISRASEALNQSRQVMVALRATIEQAKRVHIETPSESLAHSRLEELNELVENLNKRLESQPVIEQAKGILMARSHCSPDEAFEMLRRASMRMNRKLRDVAHDIVESTNGSSTARAT